MYKYPLYYNISITTIQGGDIIQSKFIKTRLYNKLSEWANSVTDDKVKDAILNDTIITGGCIVSLLQDEKPNDYDVYFRSKESLKLVAEYYVKQFIDRLPSMHKRQVQVQECYWNEGKSKWIVLHKADKEHTDTRIRIFIRSDGFVEDSEAGYAQSDKEYRQALAKINEEIKADENKSQLPPYSCVFMTNNAITLTDKIQIVLRFYGEAEDIHKNYDFVHCTSYYTSYNNKLVLPSRALEAVLNKELYYIGSKYPLASIIRTRKFLNRGYTINAGQYVKMALQLNELDLKNLHIFEEQLIGVDSAYFVGLLNTIERLKNEDNDFSMDSGYLINLINNIFDEGEKPCNTDTGGEKLST